MPSRIPASGDSHWIPPEHLEAMVTLAAERAADSAATKAVKSAMWHLGIDLDDKAKVEDARSAFTAMRERVARRRNQSQIWRTGAISGLCSLFVGVVTWGLAWSYAHAGIMMLAVGIK